jgi:hypothetical protein
MFLQNKRVDAGTGQQQSQHHAGRTAARDAAPHRHRLSTHIDLDLEERERTEGRLLVAEELYKKFWQKTRYEGFRAVLNQMTWKRGGIVFWLTRSHLFPNQ